MIGHEGPTLSGGATQHTNMEPQPAGSISNSDGNCGNSVTSRRVASLVPQRSGEDPNDVDQDATPVLNTFLHHHAAEEEDLGVTGEQSSEESDVERELAACHCIRSRMYHGIRDPLLRQAAMELIVSRDLGHSMTIFDGKRIKVRVFPPW